MFLARKPSMTFAKAPAAVKGEGGANGEASGANGGGNVQNAELAARQEKAAKQTNARKRRLLGVRWHPCLAVRARSLVVVSCVLTAPVVR